MVNTNVKYLVVLMNAQDNFLEILMETENYFRAKKLKTRLQDEMTKHGFSVDVWKQYIDDTKTWEKEIDDATAEISFNEIVD